MASNFYNSNISFFEEHSSYLYKIIMNESPLCPEVSVSCITDGGLNYIISNKYGTCYLNSLEHSENQQKRMIQQVDENTEVLVLFGFGTGMFLENIFKFRPNIEHIVVIEPCLQLFKQVLSQKDIRGIFKVNKSISIFLNQPCDEVARLLSFILRYSRGKKITFLGHITYRTIFKDMFEQIVELAKENLISDQVNLTTAYNTLHLYTYNTFKNQKHEFIFAESLFEELKKLDCPVIIVSAGPSLNNNMNQLNKLRNKAFIVAVGTATRILDVNGIKPHLRIAIDGFPSECIFDGIDTKTVPLLYTEKIHENILPQYIGMKYRMILNVDRITQYFYKDTGREYTQVASGFSVANLALGLFSMLGFKKIILMGQDLSYKNSEQYAKGASDFYKSDLEKGMIKTQDIRGNEVDTTKTFLGMKALFEKIIKYYAGITVINASEGGLHINGTIDMTLEQATSHLEVEPMLERIHEVVRQKNDLRGNMLLKVRINYAEFIRGVEKVLEISSERVEYLKERSEYEKINAVNKNIFSSFINCLNEFEAELRKIDVYRTIIYPCLEDIVLSLKNVYSYYGENEGLKVQSLYKGALAESTEVHRFALLLKGLESELEF